MPFQNGIKKILAGLNISVTSPTGPDTTIAASGGGGGITEIIAGSGVTVTNPTGPEVTIAATGGGGGIASMTGAGVDNTPGIINQAGGMSIVDTEGDGFNVSTTVGIVITTAGSGGIEIIAAGDNGGVTISSIGQETEIDAGGLGGPIAQGQVNIATQSGPGCTSAAGNQLLSTPVTVTTGVNDTFTYTPVSTGTPDVFTVAPGTYETLSDVANAIGSAVDGASTPFNSIVEPDNSGAWLALFGGAVGDTITSGPTDFLADINWAASQTFTDMCDKLSFFAENGATIQTVTGSLSTVVDPAVKAILTSLLTAIGDSAGYGLVINGTT
jgi:hypothetical protein